jgi:ribulose-phosphate 3-epimerase
MATTAHLPLLDGRAHLTIGILTADLGHLADEVRLLEDAGAELVHIDVMDGVFCPMTTVGPPVINAIRSPRLLKDAHLMIADPLDKVDAYVAAGADVVTFHVGSARNPHRVLRVLDAATNVNDPDRGIIRGAAIDPGTPVSAVEPILDELEYVLVLAVDPGWGGQRFIASTERRLAEAAELIKRSGRPILLGVDGGVTRDNIAQVAAMGPNVIVTGSAVFDGKAAAENARFMLDAIRTASPAVS